MCHVQGNFGKVKVSGKHLTGGDIWLSRDSIFITSFYLNTLYLYISFHNILAKFRKEFKMALSCCKCSKGHHIPGLTSSGRNKSTNIRSERYTQHTMSTRQGWLITNSGILRKTSCPQDKYGWSNISVL